MIRTAASTLALLMAAATLGPAFADDRHSDGYHRRVKRVCNGKENNRRWVRGNSAFARDGKGLHCGWAFRAASLKEASRRAKRSCRQKANSPCRIVFSVAK